MTFNINICIFGESTKCTLLHHVCDFEGNLSAVACIQSRVNIWLYPPADINFVSCLLILNTFARGSPTALMSQTDHKPEGFWGKFGAETEAEKPALRHRLFPCLHSLYAGLDELRCFCQFVVFRILFLFAVCCLQSRNFNAWRKDLSFLTFSPAGRGFMSGR